MRSFRIRPVRLLGSTSWLIKKTLIQIIKNEFTLHVKSRSSFQSRGQADRRETEALLQESTRNRDELKTRAQEAVRQWRAKCKRLQKELEEARAQAQFHTDKASQVS